MKKIFIFLAVIIPFLSFGQTIPDTIFVEAITDTTFLIAIGERNQNNSRLNIKYIDEVFDSVGIANFAYNRIEENENVQWEADKIKLRADALTALYGDVNQILQRFTGLGYLQITYDRHRLSYIGYYRATLGNLTTFFVLTQNGNAREVDANGQIIQGGLNGTWDIITSHRWRLNGFFPTNVLPAGSIFNRTENSGNVFRALNSNLVLTKIRAITTDGQ